MDSLKVVRVTLDGILAQAIYLSSRLRLRVKKRGNIIINIIFTVNLQ